MPVVLMVGTMKRYANVILACIAMLAAAGLAEVLTPHRLMAQSYNAFKLEDNIPFAVGPVEPPERRGGGAAASDRTGAGDL